MRDLHEKLINSLTPDLDGFICKGCHFKHCSNVFPFICWLRACAERW